jgi:hypothetical protein
MENFRYPTPAEILSARKAARLTYIQAGAVVYANSHIWLQWEKGAVPMQQAFWYLFLYRTRQQSFDPKQYVPDTVANHECAARVQSYRQARASFALEDMHPDYDSEIIQACIFAGLISPDQHQREMLAYVHQHKSLAGYMQSRAWTQPMRHVGTIAA